MRRDNRAEKNVKKKRRRKKRYLLKIFLFLLLCAGVYFGVHIDYFTVDGIAVVGNEDISDDEILKLSELKTGENIFDVHPLFAQHRIKQNLYIEKVRVKRKPEQDRDFRNGKKRTGAVPDGKAVRHYGRRRHGFGHRKGAEGSPSC